MGHDVQRQRLPTKEGAGGVSWPTFTETERDLIQENVNISLRITELEKRARRYIEAHSLSGVRFQDASNAKEYRDAEKSLLELLGSPAAIQEDKMES